MNVAIDISPLEGSHSLQHRVRGTGFYLQNLKKSLLLNFPQHSYTFFRKKEDIPKVADIIHIPYFEPFFLTVPSRNLQKTVITVHDLTPLVFPHEFPSGIRGRIKWYIQRKRLKKLRAIIADSLSSKKDIIKFAGVSESIVHAVYLAAGDEFKIIKKKSELGKIKKKYDLPESFVLYVGDATWNKNLPRLIDAVKKINLTLVLVGKALIDENFDASNSWNKDLAYVQKEIKSDKRFIRLGFISESDLVAIYNMATVLAMPSLYEGFGLPVLEAMSCGVPVITSKKGSLSEVGGGAAFYIDPTSIDDIARGIQAVYANQALQKELSEKGIQQAKKFSWRKTAAQTVAVYENTWKAGRTT